MTLDRHLTSAWWALRIGLGLAAFLAGLDKFFNLLTTWTIYLNPAVTAIVPVSAVTFMRAVGVIEMVVGIAILTRWTRLGAYVAMAWLTCIALSLVAMGAFSTWPFAISRWHCRLHAGQMTESRRARPSADRRRYRHSADSRCWSARWWLIGAPAPGAPQTQAPHAMPASTKAARPNVSAEGMRKLWTDHVSARDSSWR